MKGKTTVRTITFTGIFAALTLLATYIIKVPTPTMGYIHLGDTFVLLSGLFLGPVYGSLAAGIGSGLSDLLGGYAAWVPGTFIIKFLTALTAARVFRLLSRRRKGKASEYAVIVSGIVGEIVMVFGYFLYNILMLTLTAGALTGAGLASAAAASLAEIPFNVVQGLAGIILSSILYPVLYKAFVREVRTAEV